MAVNVIGARRQYPPAGRITPQQLRGSAARVPSSIPGLSDRILRPDQFPRPSVADHLEFPLLIAASFRAQLGRGSACCTSESLAPSGPRPATRVRSRATGPSYSLAISPPAHGSPAGRAAVQGRATWLGG